MKKMKRFISGLLALVITIGMVPLQPLHVHAAEEEPLQQYSTQSLPLEPLSYEIMVKPGQLIPETCEIEGNEIYGYVVGYELKKGHVLSISNTDYVFSVRKLVDGNYTTLLKQATTDSFTATEDMTVAMLIRKPDKSALTEEELASIVIYDSQYGMIGVEGYAHRFTVEAETIEGGTATTRAAIFLPDSYSEEGTPTRLIVMTNGHSAYLKDSVWNGNTADNVGIIRNYLDAGYAVWVVNNTADSTSRTTDIGCPQLVSSYLKAYEYIQEHFNVEKEFSIHSRSFGTFSAMRIMLERPELVKCAVMTGPRVSIKLAWTANKAFVADRFGFDDTTGATYEADKMVGHDPYTDVDGDSYALPPTFWMMASGDATAEPLEVIEKLTAHGNDVTSATYTGIDHTGICTLNTDETFADALAFLNEHQEPETLEGKTISILGASISTFAGTSNGDIADTTNSTIRNNAKYYPHATVSDVTLNDTWWMQVANDLGLRLLVNNSWSGSSLLHERNGTVGAYVDRCVQLHDDTGDNAGEMPDIIGIQMGTNDFQYYKDTLGTADIDYDTLITANGDGTYTYATPVTSLEAAAIVLHKISVRYPKAEVYYLNISQRVDGTDELIRSFNAELKQVVEHFGANIVDIYGSAITMADFDTYIGDGRVHPNKLGMDAYTEAFKASLLANTAYSVVTHTVGFDLDGVTASYGTDKTVVSGDSFSVDLSASDTLKVTVTMGGKDITDAAYANGTITIDAVTADVTVTAESVHTPQSYRWKFDGTDLVCVSGENALTKNAGTTTGGVFDKTHYALETAVQLLHDEPWAVEWKCQGTFLNTNGSSGARVFTTTDVNAEYNARYIFKSNNSGIIAMGEKTTTGSHNYGIALADYDIDWTALHTYRLENRVADGSNMIWLYVDGEEIGALNHYYVGTTDKNTTSDWLSGKDFIFPYMGTDTHGFTNASIDYIQVWESHTHSYTAVVTAPTCTQQGYTTHTCACGDSYVDSYVDASGHSYENSVCVNCGQMQAEQLVDGFHTVSAIEPGDSRLVDAHNTVSPLILQDLTLFENCSISAVNLFVTGTVVDNDSTNANDPEIDDNTVYTFDLVVLDASSVKAGEHYAVKRTYTLSVLGSDIEKNAWNTFDVSHLGITVKTGETLGFGSSTSTLEIFYLNQCVTSKLCYFGHKTTTGNTTLSLRTGFNLPVGVEGYKIECTHQYEPIVTAPTCTKLGYTTHTCVHCGDSHKDAFTDAAGHSWEEGVCTACGAEKKPYQRLTYFTVDVVGDNGKVYTDNAVLYLPADYSPDGEPVKLVIYCKQGASQITSTTNPIEAVGFYNYLISLGYAVLGVDGVPDAWRDELGLGERAVGNPMAVQGTQRAYDYVVDNYNIASDGCFISGYSQGGHYAQNVIDLTDIPILAAAEQSPVCSMRYHQWDLNASVTVNSVKFTKAARLNVARIYGFPEVSTNAELLNLAYDASLVDAYDPWVRNSENIYTGFVQKSNLWYLPEGTSLDDITMKKSVKCPVKIWCAEDDTAISADVMQVFVKAIQNAGGTAEISIALSGGHGFFQKQTAVGTFTENGKPYNTLPIAVEIAQWFEQYGGYKCQHNYSGTICTVCGAEHPEAADYAGKVISILGDSISTFAGYIPAADGFNLEHVARYPQDNLLTDVNDTWWMQVLTSLDAKLGINESWRSTEVGNIYDVEVNSGYEGTKVCMASLTRIQNLGSNGTPDVIFFYGGTNDITQRRTVGTFDPDTAPTEVNLTSVKWDTVADAYVAAIMRMQYYYPDAQIIAMLPTFTYKNTDAVIEQYNSVFAAICEHYGVTYIDLRDCGITTADLPDGTHPDAEGMDYITDAVLDILLTECDMEAGENTVYSVSHNLNGAEASLGYYQGVSAGKSFVETITGENLTVNITMGGVDITASVYAGGVINIPSVAGDIDITAVGVEKPVYADHLQQLPENICPGVNLWTALEPENAYYTASGWGNLANGQAWSVTIPLSEGDRIYATSFEAYGANGNASSTSSGIRVTFFDAQGVNKTLKPAETYAEFTANGGYLIAPEGTVAVNIPMWTNSDTWEIYILNRAHTYESTVTAPSCTEQGYTTYTCACGDSYVDSYVDALGHTYKGLYCTICGAEHPEAADYAGKVISILSASTSTFAGYIPVADGFNLEHRPRYPQDNLLTDVNETWWMQVINELDAKLGINDSWAGSTVSNFIDGNSGDLGEDAAMASLTRIQNLGSNGTPDLILFYGGGNDMGRGVTLGSFNPETAPTEVDLTATKWDSFADAYVAAIMRLQYFYPDSEIVVIMSHEMPSYVTAAKLDKYGPVMKDICEHYGVKYVDLLDCGINFDMLPDNVHPNAEGMDYITADVLDTLLNRVGMTAGENTVHSVTHELTNAASSLGYYKGVSHGKSFVTTVKGENLTVTVTMGGTDITASVYADGVVNIPDVTGDIVITAKGKFNADGRLQQLPEDICAGTNLWTLLEPKNEYYLGTQWGLYTSAPNVHSVTIPVSAGDKLWATSFGPAAGDKTGNGTRITWFDENGVLESVARDVVYSEFQANGCITVPAGATAVNIPMPTGADTWELYILNREHSYADGICEHCGAKRGAIYAEHLQQLPEIVCSGTNLWPLLEPENQYYTANGWGLFASEPNVHSVTIPVTAGEKLWATSFGKTGENGLSASGTRITWFSEDGVLASLIRDVVYAEFATNGYITVPEGAVAVNIPMASAADTWEIYILNRAHTYESVVTAPSCTERGYTTHTCACGDSYVDSYVNATGHSMGNWIETKAPTCTERGAERRDCANCDHFESREVVAKGHSYESVVTVPTCTERGYTTHTCSVCGDSYVDSYVNATGHSMGDWYETKAATCTARGTEQRDCDNCDHFESRETEAKGHSYKAVVTASTCTERGYTTYTCSCGDSYVDSYVNATGHSMGDWTETKAPTCMEEGTEQSDCANCDHVETRVVAAIGHSYMVEVTAATCAEQGYTTHICSNCGDSYVDSYTAALGHEYGEWYQTKAPTYTEEGEERRDCSRCNEYQTRTVAALQHQYSETVVAPTCTEQGYTIHTCAECDGEYIDTYVAALGHSFTKYASNGDATCTADGTRTAKCDRCDVTDTVTDVNSKTGHSMGDWYETKTPTCTVKGTERRDCANCDHFETREVVAKVHSYKRVVTAPTCTERGYTTHTCSVCGDSYVDSYVNAIGHSMGEWYETKAATCTARGTEQRDCANCDHFETRETEAKGHSYKDVVTAPTCTERGYTTHTCACGDSYVDSYVNATGHFMGQWYETKAPTCTVKGTERRDCANCDHVEIREVEAKGHSYESVVTAPTCTERGYTTHTCACGDSYVDSYVNAIGHTMGDWFETKAPTCTKAGTERRDCANCDHVETRETEAKGHSYKDVVTAPTCTERGYTTRTCSVCGDGYIDSYVNATGHSMGDWYETKTPTCTVKGTERRDCANCDHFETRETEAKGHSYKSVETAPTCTERGYITHTCSVCGDSYVDSYVNAIGHSMGNWIETKAPTCTERGAERRDCANCDHFESREVVAKGHSYESVVTAPTCTERGYTTHTCACGDSYVDAYTAVLGHAYGKWRETKAPSYIEEGEERRDCSRCDEYQTRTVAALQHQYSETVVAPTCTEQGYTIHTCAECDGEYIDTYVAALGHSFTKYASNGDATCTADGTRTAKCDRCDVTDTVTDVNSKTGHSMGDWYETKTPTCTVKGTEQRDCANCDHVEIREVEEKGHSYKAVVTASTCTERGYTTYTCYCGDSYTADYISAKGHTEVIDKAVAATCTEPGLTEGKHCSVCGAVTVAQKEIAATGHSWDAGKVTTEPTEETEGVRTYTCTGCGAEKTETIPTLDHVHVYEAQVMAPTCTRNGYTSYTCKCGACYEADETPALGHDAVVDEGKDAACTEDGLTEGSHCGRCEEVLVEQEVIPAAGHSWDDGVITTEPTENSDGIRTYTCTACGAEKTETVPALEHTHSYTPVVTAPTCTEAGYTTYTCACGDSYVSDEAAALGHDVVVDEGKEASCTEGGLTEGSHCGRCEEVLVKQETVAATGHNWGQWVETVKPDASNDGVNTRMCTACGETETESVDNNPFTDVKADRFEDAILWAYYNGITTGTGDGTTFSPEDTCTRKQIVTFLWRAAGEPEPKSMENPFTDVKSDRFEKAILWAYYEGITTGTGDGTTFSPENTCTRKQIVTFLWRYHGEPAPKNTENKFVDVKNDRFASAILWAAEQGITTGTGDGTTFSPEEPCTRKQIVTFLYRDLAAQIQGVEADPTTDLQRLFRRA